MLLLLNAASGTIPGCEQKRRNGERAVAPRSRGEPDKRRVVRAAALAATRPAEFGLQPTAGWFTSVRKKPV
ncbi:hypothetical protein [Sphingorhabdus sp.]|uniref:hypothetical protein n=1 Tax=Sphingorhabdus sp. TaxID=1902408 RepID=UPI002BE7A4B3|nr:hypothetical protein [Sphingorhabdus sp.]HMT41606.1 hypothetical protein [Sphingorhabdus sp.]